MKKSTKAICAAMTAVTVMSMGVATAFAGETTDSLPTKAMKLFRNASTTTDSENTDRVRGGKASMGSLTEEQMEALMTETAAQTKTALAELVAAGTISQDIADQLAAQKTKTVRTERLALTDEQKAAMETQKAEKGTRPELTEEQKAAMEAKRAEKGTKLALTDEQKAAMEAKRAEMPEGTKHEKGGMHGISNLNLTDDQMSAVKTAMGSAHTAAIEKLAAAGTITADQAKELSERPAKKTTATEETAS